MVKYPALDNLQADFVNQVRTFVDNCANLPEIPADQKEPLRDKVFCQIIRQILTVRREVLKAAGLIEDLHAR